MDEDWKYTPPVECIANCMLSNLESVTRIAELAPSYKDAFRKINLDIDNAQVARECRRRVLRSLIQHRLLRRETLVTLSSTILPVAEANIDLVVELVFRNSHFYNALHATLREHPDVAMALMHSTSTWDTTLYHYGIAVWEPFPWHLLTLKRFWDQYFEVQVPSETHVPHALVVSDWVCRLIKNKFPAFLAAEPAELPWIARIFLELTREIAARYRSASARRSDLEERIEWLRDALSTTKDLVKATNAEYATKLDELDFWMVHEFVQFGNADAAAWAVRRAKVVADVYMMPLFASVMNDRPVLLGDCLTANVKYTLASDPMPLIMEAFFDATLHPLPELTVGDPSVLANADPVYEWDGDFLSALRRIHRTEQIDPANAVSTFFEAWAAEQTEENALKFMRRFTKLSYPVAATLQHFPASWASYASCARELIANDVCIITSIVQDFIESGHPIIDMTLWSDSPDEVVLTRQCVLVPPYDSMETSAIPLFPVMLRACFQFEEFPPPSRRPGYLPLCKSTFALAMVAYCDAPEKAKAIILDKMRHFNVPSGHIFILLPNVLRKAVIEDRAYLETFVAKFPYEMRNLGELQYDRELLKLALESNPTCYFHITNPLRLIKIPEIMELLLSNNLTVQKAFESLPEAEQETPSLGCSIIADERLSVQTRRNFYNRTMPMVVKHNGRCKRLAARFFGPEILERQGDALDLGCELTTQLLRIVHDSHASSGDGSRSEHIGYLRSLYYDMVNTFLPPEIAAHVKIPVYNREAHSSYNDTKPDWQASWNGFELGSATAVPDDLETQDAPARRKFHSDVCELKTFLDDVSDLVAMILEPRRRDGASYPACNYSEKFEGVYVEYRFRKSDDKFPTLVTMSSRMPIAIPASWKQQMEAEFTLGNLFPFWGVLFAGYGQRSKATKLKNGTLSGDAEWQGVTIKVYQTISETATGYKNTRSFFPVGKSRHPSFVEFVPVSVFQNYDISKKDEEEILTLHRQSRTNGGAGVVFRSMDTPTRLITMDAAGFTMYAQKIIDFLYEYPLHILSTYAMESDMLGCDERDEDEDGPFPNLKTIVDKMAAQAAAASTKRASQAGPRAKRPRVVLEGAPSTKAPVPAAAAAAAAPAPAKATTSMAHYWDSSSDDGDEASADSDDDVPPPPRKAAVAPKRRRFGRRTVFDDSSDSDCSS